MQDGLILHDIKQYPQDYPTCSTEKSVIHQSILQHRTEIGVIEAKIAAIELELNSAIQRRNQIHTSCKVAESLVAPIRAVPVDILQKIFLYSIPHIPASSIDGTRNFEFIPHGWTYPDRVRANIMSVSRHWHTTALSTPAVWSTVILSSRHSFRRYYLEPLFSRSKDHQLDVYMRPQISIGQPSDFFASWQEFKAVVALIRSHMARIRILAVDSRSSAVQAVLRELFSAGAPTDMKNLLTFGALESNVSAGYSIHSPSELSHGTINAPNLFTLTLSPASITFLETFTPRSLIQLERMTISTLYWCFPPNIDRLSLCHKLRYLCWRDVGGVCRRTNMPKSVFLPSLKELELVTISPNYMIPFLRSLDAPELESLDFRTTGASSHPSMPHPNGADVIVMFLPKVPRIQHILLTSMSWIGRSVESATQYLTLLTSVTVTDCCLDATFFNTFPVASNHTLEPLRLYINPTQFLIKRRENPALPPP
ncbi:hypothetical protein BU17DRAFT_86877 [Hysterangium stoloniferum]|nr:hypothetical protein BU17DRAFT_86877 [Hysterangium stoloniferum]